MLKKIILKKKLNQNISGFVLKSYPEHIKHILVIYNGYDEGTDEFIRQLSQFFKNDVFVNKVNLDDAEKQDDCNVLSKKSINFKGHFKDKSFGNWISKTNLIIDLTETDSIVKNYAISKASHAYKISLNYDYKTLFHLIIKLDSKDLDQFFHEFAKYHNAFKHG